MQQLSVPTQFKKSAHVIMARREGDAAYSALDRKIFHVLLATASPRLMETDVHRIMMPDLQNLATDGPVTVANVKEALERLWRNKIAIDYEEEGQSKMIRCNYLSFKYDEAGGIVDYAFDPIMLRFLHEPKIYSLIQLEISRSIRSNEAMKLYEIMQMRLNLSMSAPRLVLTYDEIRAFLDADDRYEGRPPLFKSRVLDKAIREVNQHAPFVVTADWNKGGRGQKLQSVTLSVRRKALGDGRRPGQSRDGLTHDLFLGVSDEDRTRPPQLSPDVLDEAALALGEDCDLDAVVAEWFSGQGDGCFVKPDEKFRSFVRIKAARIEKDKRQSLQDIDVDSLFADFENEL